MVIRHRCMWLNVYNGISIRLSIGYIPQKYL